eukprot:1474669-Amphidinium_carterae.1
MDTTMRSDYSEDLSSYHRSVLHKGQIEYQAGRPQLVGQRAGGEYTSRYERRRSFRLTCRRRV